MKLVSFEISKFRNIVKSGVINVQQDVTCLVGKNESGKTAILNALYRLNPAYNVKFDLGEHYPRWMLVADRRSGVANAAKPVTGKFELDDADMDALNTSYGPDVVKSRTFSYTRGYESNSAGLTVDDEAALKYFFGNSDTQQTTRDLFKDVKTMEDLRTAVTTMQFDEELEKPTVEDVQLLQRELNLVLDKSATLWQAVLATLLRRMPKFFYFSGYSVLPGRIDLDDLDSDPDGPARSGVQTARALLQLANTTTDTLRDDDYEERTAELEAVSNELTNQVFDYWSQNEKLEVIIDVDKKTVKVPGNYGQEERAVARFLEVRVKDRRHGFTSNFSQRSAGFQWFFSFLAAFSEFEGKSDNVVVLLDEPGLALHAKAQADFLRFINERLASAAQVIYTTHSPFMVEPGRLERVRMVEDKGKDRGTEVSSEVLSVDSDTIFPLQAALGYDIAQNLFIGPNNLLVEGTSDFTYLTIISEYLESKSREGLDPRWRILPTGSVANVPSFVALMGRNLDVTVFVDAGASGMQRIENLSAQGLLKAKRLLTVGDVTGAKKADIEDLFDPADYLKLLYNPAFGTSLTVSKLKPGDRLIDRISRTQGSDFTKHGKPADYLLRNSDKILDKLSDATLDNFEAAIKKINATKSK